MDFPFDLQELPAFAVIGSVGLPAEGVVSREWVRLRVGRDPSWTEGEVGVGKVAREVVQKRKVGCWYAFLCSRWV